MTSDTLPLTGSHNRLQWNKAASQSILPGLNSSNTSRQVSATYTISLSATFQELHAYIDAKQCIGNVECTRIVSSADHCCGRNLSFALSLLLTCSLAGIEAVKLTNFEFLTPIWIEQDIPLLGEQLHLADLGAKISRAIKERITRLLSTTKIPWGAHPLTLLEFVSRLSLNNAPGGKLDCSS